MIRPFLRPSICAACRLHQAIADKYLLRCRKSVFQHASYVNLHQSASLSARQRTTLRRIASDTQSSSHVTTEQLYDDDVEQESAEDVVRKAREIYGDRLPDGFLSEEQGRVYERLYGRPLKTIDELDDGLNTAPEPGTEVLEAQNEDWKEVVIDENTMQYDADAIEDGDDAQLAHDMEEAIDEDFDEEVEEDRDDEIRAHPLTIANRFGTKPLAIQPPKDTLVDLISVLTSGMSPKHITSAAHRVFGGFGLPDSTSTPRLGTVKQQKPMPLHVAQSRMSEIDADVYMSVLMPAIYASTLSVLVETRKRLGTAWAESLVHKAEAGQLKILDAGGAGMGILAVRDLLKAEWERMHEERERPNTVAVADGKVGGASAVPPQGTATVYVSSDALRHRASHLLENTTFIPRMPDYIHTEQAKQIGKFDIILAPHTIWPIKEDWARRTHVENLWSLLSADGGVLCLLEKGVARGFEAVAAARDMLLKTRIATTDVQGENIALTFGGDVEWETARTRDKEAGMIIAPCTNHEECPMYSGDKTGTIKGRKDICHFKQRYVRPPFLQKILGAKDKNFEDLKFSYLSVMRGRDLRSAKTANPAAVQGPAATEKAFDGHGQGEPPSSLSLPRAILPPLKRKGHVIIDVCTPAGQIERWTVPRSFSKQAFHDARKSAWGDLWALGAKTRIGRTVRLGKHARKEEKKKFELSKKAKKEKRRILERKSGSGGRPIRDL